MDKNEQKDWTDNLNKIEEKETDKFSFLEFIWDLLKTAIVVVIIAFGIKYFVVQPFIVEGSSMEANFHNNEYLLVEKISYRLHGPQRGDVVVFVPPGQNDVNYIKRVIGLAGETVVIADNKIKIINSAHPEGIYLDESYISNAVKTISNKTDGTYHVGSNEFFVLGDNREHSSDSREWGLLPRSNIIGKTWANIYPFKDFGLIHHQVFSE